MVEAARELGHWQVLAAFRLLWTRFLQGFLPWTVLLVIWTSINTFWLFFLLIGQVRRPAHRALCAPAHQSRSGAVHLTPVLIHTALLERVVQLDDV